MTRLCQILAIAPFVVAQSAIAQGPERQWQLGRLLFTIGSETDAHSQFARIVTILLLPDSGVVVANGGSKELRFFDAGGRFVRQVGRDGSGPGEYRFFDRVFRLAGDSLGVYDGSLRRLTVVSNAGVLARTVTLARPSGVTGVGGPTPVGGFADGSFASFVAPAPTPGPGQERGALHRLTATWFRHGANGEFIATLGESPGGERFLELTDGMVVNWAVPFQRTMRAAVSGDRVFAGDGTEPSVAALHRDRVGSGTIRLNHGTLTVTPAEVAAYRQEQLDRAPSAAYRTRLETSFSKAPTPTSVPAFAELRVDTEGAVWVQDYPRPGASTIHWRVVTAGGAPIASINVPPRFAITDIRDNRVAGVWRDENDVETVRVYQLRR
jgi:6-bladed beta-propeller